MTPEGKARQNINALLVAEGWHVCNVADLTQILVVAEVDRHLSIAREVEADVDAKLKRAESLTQPLLLSECFAPQSDIHASQSKNH